MFKFKITQKLMFIITQKLRFIITQKLKLIITQKLKFIITQKLKEPQMLQIQISLKVTLISVNIFVGRRCRRLQKYLLPMVPMILLGGAGARKTPQDFFLNLHQGGPSSRYSST